MLQGRCCAECGKLSLDAGQLCPFCGSQGGSAVALSGRGRLLSWTVIRVAPGRYAGEAPYAVGLLQLEEGLRLTARLEGDLERWHAGQAVSVASLDPARGPIFRLA